MADFDFLELLASLQGSKRVTLSLSPDNPRNEKDYEFIEHQLIPTITGFVLILKLKDLETNEEVTVSYSDIQNVERNDFSNAQFGKYYLKCLSRKTYFTYKENLKWKEQGISVDEAELSSLRKDSHMTFRIITKFDV